MLCRSALTLCDQLVARSNGLAVQLGLQGDEQTHLQALSFTSAAWHIVEACAKLCRGLPLQPGERLRLLGTARILYDLGRLTLSSLHSEAAGEPADGANRALLLINVGAQLSASDVLTSVGLKGDSSGRLEAVFARTTAKPAALLPWLAAVTEALQLACSDLDAASGELPSLRLLHRRIGYACLPAVNTCPDSPIPWPAADEAVNATTSYLQLLKWLLTLRGWDQHRAELQAQPALRAAVVDCLLWQVLPVVAARMEMAAAAGPNWEAVQPADAAQVGAITFLPSDQRRQGSTMQPGLGEIWLEGLLRSEGTRSFCQLHLAITFANMLRQPGELPWQAAAAVMPIVTRSAAALPQQRPAAMPSRAFAIMHASVVALAAMWSHALSDEAARQLALHQTPAAQTAWNSFISDQLSPAAWAVVRLLPYMARTLRAVAADLPEVVEDFAALASMCADVLQLLADAGPQRSWQVGSWEQALEWAGAADAGLRLLPTLSQAGDTGSQLLVGSLPAALLTGLGLQGAHAMEEWCMRSDRPPVDDTCHTLASQLWQLHSSVARMVHFSAGGIPSMPLSEGARQLWPSAQLELLYFTFNLAHNFLRLGQQPSRWAFQRLHARLCVVDLQVKTYVAQGRPARQLTPSLLPHCAVTGAPRRSASRTCRPCCGRRRSFYLQSPWGTSMRW